MIDLEDVCISLENDLDELIKENKDYTRKLEFFRIGLSLIKDQCNEVKEVIRLYNDAEYAALENFDR